MALRHVAAATTLALVGAMLAAGPAQARPQVDQSARDGDHFPVTVSTTVSPGGTSMITTPAIGKDVKTLTVTVKPKNQDATDPDIYDQFTHTMGTLAKSKRLLVCTMMYALFVSPQDYSGDYQAHALSSSLAGAVLLACLQLAGLLDGSNRSSDRARSSAAGGKCPQIKPSLPATVTKVDGGYSVEASGTAKKARKPKLKIKCRSSGHTMKYTIRSAKKGVSLRKAAGKKIMVGMKSPDDASSSVPVKVTFNTP